MLDLLCEYFPQWDRERLYALILCGDVTVVGEGVIRNPRLPLASDSEFLLKDNDDVSRGAGKLRGALDLWGLDIQGQVLLDAGASAGGFTQVLLEKGAALVHAVDVGRNQLDYRLRMDDRVRVLEETNIMELECLEPQPRGAVADLSFRSMKGAAARILSLTTHKWAVILVKPQFETNQESHLDRGVIRDLTLIPGILQKLGRQLEEEGIGINAWLPSSVKGRRGNQEFLFWIVDLQSNPGEIPRNLQELFQEWESWVRAQN